MLSVQLPWWRDLKQHAMGKQEALSNPKINCVYSNSQISNEKNASRKSCRGPFETTEKIRVHWTCRHPGNPAYLGKVEIWGFSPAAITSRLSVAQGSFLVIQNWGSHTADCSDTVAQLKPVKHDKSWLCQACTIQSTAEMTIAEDSAHAGGIRSKTMTDRILRRSVH